MDLKFHNMFIPKKKRFTKKNSKTRIGWEEIKGNKLMKGKKEDEDEDEEMKVEIKV